MLLVHLFLRCGGVQQRLGFVLCHAKLVAHYALNAWYNCEAEKVVRLDMIYRDLMFRAYAGPGGKNLLKQKPTRVPPKRQLDQP